MLGLPIDEFVSHQAILYSVARVAVGLIFGCRWLVTFIPHSISATFAGPGQSQAHHAYQAPHTTIHTRASTRTLQTILTLHPSFHGALVCTARSVLLLKTATGPARPAPRTRVNFVVSPHKQRIFFFLLERAAGTRCRTAPDLLCVNLRPRVLLSPYDKVQAHLAPSTSSTITVLGVCMQYIHPPLKIFPIRPLSLQPVPTNWHLCFNSLAALPCNFFLVCLPSTANPLRLGQTRLALDLPCDTGSSIAAALWTIDNCHGAPTVNPA